MVTARSAISVGWALTALFQIEVGADGKVGGAEAVRRPRPLHFSVRSQPFDVAVDTLNPAPLRAGCHHVGVGSFTKLSVGAESWWSRGAQVDRISMASWLCHAVIR